MNLKRLGAIALGSIVCLTAVAVPAKRGVRTFTQADGTVISVSLVGDERFHTFITEDGLAVERKADGNFYYRTYAGVSAMQAHNPSMRSEAEKTFVKTNRAQLGTEALSKAAKARRAASRVPRKLESQVPNKGKSSIPVLLVQYKDYKFKDTDPKATFEAFFSHGSTSAYQYFYDQSNGDYDPSFDVYGPVTLANNRAAYGGNDMYGNDKGVGNMVGEACQALDSQIDFSKYDNNGDGECDVVIVLYAGDGEASSYDEDCENAVWPCQWQLDDTEFGKTLRQDGTTINKFAVFNELNGVNLSKIDGIGTFCHEFSHCLGLPDFYDTQYGPHFGMGPWSLMDSGCYNNNGYTPIGYSAYEKNFMGWIDIPEATVNTQYTLPAMNLKQKETDLAVRITNPRDKNEYFIIENRANTGWDKYMVAEGLLITHVTYDESAWNNNTVNDYDLQRMTVVPADNNLKLDSQTQYGQTYYNPNEASLLGDLWPNNGATEFTDTTKPAAKFNTGNVMAGKPVTEMTIAEDGSASFWVAKEQAPAVATPVVTEHSDVTATSFTANWNAVEGQDVTYTLEVKEHSDVKELMSVDFADGVPADWTTSGYTIAESGSVRLGSSNQMGSVTSPAVSASGTVTVKVRAASYGSDGSSLKVQLLDSADKEVAAQTVELSSQADDYAVVMDAADAGEVKVCFSIVAKKKRVYLYSASLWSGDADKAAARRNAAVVTGDATAMTITGITGTSYKVTGLKEKGVYDYRVRAVPVDTENFSASSWSELKTVTLTDDAGVSDIAADADANAPAEYFTLQGVRVSGTPAPGIYIRRSGSVVSKVVVR